MNFFPDRDCLNSSSLPLPCRCPYRSTYRFESIVGNMDMAANAAAKAVAALRGSKRARRKQDRLAGDAPKAARGHKAAWGRKA